LIEPPKAWLKRTNLWHETNKSLEGIKAIKRYRPDDVGVKMYLLQHLSHMQSEGKPMFDPLC